MPKKRESGVGQTVRDWLTKKLGNPIMPSKEKDQIHQLEQEENLRRRQENGEDYDAKKEHVRRSGNIRFYRG
ncbi:MAG: hypothetical protein UW18_C0020G0011 [Microgenomates group bacterium GW2011_GWF1_44_10]|nr:MAG: hypothetical protein UW18_C0020G0011 [Microgenomates group bacterium GW2011_GWF1_44_10]